ncbi:hypothetical protein EVAR_85522_1 [Eumeta japonica]|uniref:Uncharacterized protein n=1 Tax=Eumeta variegata TaxID=151549 RepID=A0A4C1VE84_EUMVA|nr:hypothetical protein EVAR_85522_1 [Eumeta japonica]
MWHYRLLSKSLGNTSTPPALMREVMLFLEGLNFMSRSKTQSQNCARYAPEFHKAAASHCDHTPCFHPGNSTTVLEKRRCARAYTNDNAFLTSSRRVNFTARKLRRVFVLLPN